MVNFPSQRELPACLRPDKAGADWNEPLDSFDLATRLETEGVTDTVAQTHYGFRTTWEMADAHLRDVLTYEKPVTESNDRASAWREYCKGIAFALPLLASSLAVLFVGFALWGGRLSVEQATAVGLGTIASFFLSGGFVQAMARRGLFFEGTRQFRRGAASAWWWFRAGAIALVSAALFFCAVSSYFQWLPPDLSAATAAFAVSLGLFWLATGILHYLNRSLWILAITVAGIAAACFFHFVIGLALLTSQVLAVLCAASAAAIAAAHLLRRNLEESHTKTAPTVRYRDAWLLLPYFIYGLAYYALLFVDRLMAWTAHTHASPLVVQFRGDYETALNLGLIGFAFQVGWVQVSIAEFYRELPRAQRQFFIHQSAQFREALNRFYWKRLRIFIPFALASSVIPLALAAGPIQHRIAFATAAWSVAAFPILVIGLWHVSLLFGLGRPWKAAAAAAIATVIDLLGGYALSRIGNHHQAVIGFMLGALTFALLSGYWTRQALRRADHAWFRATA